MPEPNEYLIVRNLQSALGLMQVAGGYYYDVGDTAVKLDPNQDVESFIAPNGPRPFIVIDVQPEEWTYSPAMVVALVMPVTIHWVNDSDPTDDQSRMRTFFRGCADVERAITVDITRGGLAFDTRMVKRTSNRAVDGSLVWAAIDTTIRINRNYGKP